MCLDKKYDKIRDQTFLVLQSQSQSHVQGFQAEGVCSWSSKYISKSLKYFLPHLPSSQTCGKSCDTISQSPEFGYRLQQAANYESFQTSCCVVLKDRRSICLNMFESFQLHVDHLECPNGMLKHFFGMPMTFCVHNLSTSMQIAPFTSCFRRDDYKATPQQH